MGNIITIKSLNKTTFYQLPKAFFYNEKYKNMKNESKIAYSLLKNLVVLSIDKGWYNEKGEIYVKLSRTKMMSYLNIKGTQKMTQIMKELNENGLIIEKRVGLNKCNEIYLYEPEELNIKYNDEELFEDDAYSELEQLTVNKENEGTFENQKSKSFKIKSQESRKSKVQTFEKQKHIKNSIDIKNDLNIKNNNIEKKRKEDSPTLPLDIRDIGINKYCFNLLIKDTYFKHIDFNENKYYMALVESIAITQEKDNIEEVGMKQYGYLRNTLKNKIDLIK